jgi:hypothetical protein
MLREQALKARFMQLCTYPVGESRFQRWRLVFYESWGRCPGLEIERGAFGAKTRFDVSPRRPQRAVPTMIICLNQGTIGRAKTETRIWGRRFNPV